MTREEIEKKIEDLETKIFYNLMADHWSTEDFEYDRKLRGEVLELKKILENL